MLGKKSLDTCQFDDSRTHTGGILVSFWKKDRQQATKYLQK
jgi:hypothetical protein